MKMDACTTAFVTCMGGHYVNSADTPLQEYELSNKAQEALFRLNRFHELKENWDSYGAAVPKVMVVLEARRFVQAMDRSGLEPYFVSPGPNGEVMVEYRTEVGVEAEVHFKEDHGRYLLVSREDEFVFDGPFDLKAFMHHVAGRAA
jgi:hypothetical protein